MAAPLKLRIHVRDPLPGLGYRLQHGKGANTQNGPIVETSGDDPSFDLEVNAAPSKDGETVNITGAYAQGKPQERFFYLSVVTFDERGEAKPVGRVKVPVFAIPWELGRDALRENRTLEAGFNARRGDRPALASIELDPDWHIV